MINTITHTWLQPFAPNSTELSKQLRAVIDARPSESEGAKLEVPSQCLALTGAQVSGDIL